MDTFTAVGLRRIARACGGALEELAEPDPAGALIQQPRADGLQPPDHLKTMAATQEGLPQSPYDQLLDNQVWLGLEENDFDLTILNSPGFLELGSGGIRGFAGGRLP